MTKIEYKSEINFLRAFAVLSVIAYHSKFSLINKEIFSGGYIGVDIFFVISGYLISKIIFLELKEKSKFNFINFYIKRFKRIFPALFIVILFSFILGSFFLLPNDFVDFSKSALSSLSFLSNYYFYFSQIKYNASDALLLPLLHTWSLSVEWQFYIILPIIMSFFYKKFSIQKLLIVLFAFSLSLSFIGANNFFELNFYSFHSRIWEFIAGSLVAYKNVFSKKKIFLKKLNQDILLISNFIILALSVFYFDEYTKHPSIVTLIPVLSTCCILLLGVSKKSYVFNFINLNLFNFIGRISYSLYLWHFPIFAYARLTEFARGNFENKILIIFFTFFFSILSFYFIENKFRYKKYNLGKSVIFLCSILFAIVFLKYTIHKSGYEARLPPILKNYKSFSVEENVCTSYSGCFFDNKSKKTIFAIGDSHLRSIGFDLKRRILNQKYNLHLNIMNGCVYFPGFSLVHRNTNKIYNKCDDKYFSLIREKLLKSEKSTIILFGRWPIYFDEYYLSSNYFFNQNLNPVGKKSISFYRPAQNGLSNFKEEFKKSILELLNYGHKVVIIYPVPEVGWNVPRKIFVKTSSWFGKNNLYLETEKLTIPYKVYDFRIKSFNSIFSNFKHENLSFIYPGNIFCNMKNNVCYTHSKNKIYYTDNNHLSAYGAEKLNIEIVNQLKKIF